MGGEATAAIFSEPTPSYPDNRAAAVVFGLCGVEIRPIPLGLAEVYKRKRIPWNVRSGGCTQPSRSMRQPDRRLCFPGAAGSKPATRGVLTGSGDEKTPANPPRFRFSGSSVSRWKRGSEFRVQRECTSGEPPGRDRWDSH